MVDAVAVDAAEDIWDTGPRDDFLLTIVKSIGALLDQEKKRQALGIGNLDANKVFLYIYAVEFAYNKSMLRYRRVKKKFVRRAAKARCGPLASGFTYTEHPGRTEACEFELKGQQASFMCLWCVTDIQSSITSCEKLSRVLNVETTRTRTEPSPTVYRCHRCCT